MTIARDQDCAAQRYQGAEQDQHNQQSPRRRLGVQPAEQRCDEANSRGATPGGPVGDVEDRDQQEQSRCR